MKLIHMFVLTVICAFVSVGSMWASDESEKLYIPKEAIILDEEGMSVEVGADRVKITALHYDENGFYIDEEELIPKGYCRHCDDTHTGSCEPRMRYYAEEEKKKSRRLVDIEAEKEAKRREERQKNNR